MFFVVAVFVVVAVPNQILTYDEKLENAKNSLVYCGYRLLWRAHF